MVRLHQVTHAMREHTWSGQSVGADTLVRIGGFAPPTLHALGARAASGISKRIFNLVVTNVPGPQFPLYAAGARMLEMFPVVPLAKGQALSIGLTSYDGGVFYGFNADRDAMPDVDVLAGMVDESLDELLMASGVRSWDLMRVYVPATVADAAHVGRRTGSLEPIGGTAFALTPRLRESYTSGDDEELEYAAMTEAARASLRLLAVEFGLGEDADARRGAWWSPPTSTTSPCVPTSTTARCGSPAPVPMERDRRGARRHRGGRLRGAPGRRRRSTPRTWATWTPSSSSARPRTTSWPGTTRPRWPSWSTWGSRECSPVSAGLALTSPCPQPPP